MKMRSYPVVYIEALLASEERLAMVLEEVVANLRAGCIDSRKDLDAQTLLIDSALKMRPVRYDPCNGSDEDLS